MSAQSAESSTPAVIGRPFRPGQSGNPGGRAKGAAAKARELLGNDPSAILTAFLAIVADETAKDSDRIAAGREILDRGWGKSAAYAPVEEGDPLELDVSESAIGRLVDDLASRRETKAPRPAANGKVAAAGENGAASTEG